MYYELYSQKDIVVENKKVRALKKMKDFSWATPKYEINKVLGTDRNHSGRQMFSRKILFYSFIL